MTLCGWLECDVIERREEIAQSIGEIIEDVAAGWGVQSKRIGESKIIAAKGEVEAAKLMRQAAEIRYLEAMQAMAKSANSKVIFLPGANQTMPSNTAFHAALAHDNEAGEPIVSPANFGDFGGGDSASSWP